MKIVLFALAVALIALVGCINYYPPAAAPAPGQAASSQGPSTPSQSATPPGQIYQNQPGQGGVMGGYQYGPGQGGSYPYGPGGMMGGGYYGGYGPGGMMGYGYGGMMGSGNIGPGGPYRAQGQRITMDRATSIAQNYLTNRNDPDLDLAEIMEFDYNFYAEFYEKSTGIYAFEALIDPYTGDMYPEPGPNMMWNTRYGMMSGVMWGVPNSGQMTVTPDQALADGQKFVDGYLPGGKVEEPHRFYGYYTMHVYQNGNIYGMLSVNGYTGQVWYHSWHGRYIGMKEFRQE